MRILLVEDDRQLAQGLCRALQQSDYAVDWIADGTQADSVLKTEAYDLIILDQMLPGMVGLSVLRKLRARGVDAPALFVAARDDVSARVEGLDLGADDYIGKPFELTELEARIRALLRRSQGRASGRIVYGPVELDTTARRVTIDGDDVILPRRELCLLKILLTRPDKVVSKEVITSQMFSFDEEVSPNTIEIYISRLRKKLAACGITIRAIRGLGYLIEKP